MSNLLQFIWYKDLVNWSVSNYAPINHTKTKYNLVQVFKILQQVKNYEVLTDTKNYRLSGIHSYGGGLFHRNIKLGENIKSKNLNKLQTNQFIYSRLGSHTGSFDIVKSEFNNYYVSSEVPTFEFINNYVNPYFFKLVFLLKKYWQDIEKSLQGTAHKRFKESDFLNLQIPLPPLDIQKQLVKNYQDKINLAQKQEQIAKQKETEIENYLYKELGIKLPSKEKQNTDILQFVGFKYLDRWDVAYLLNKNQINADYNIVPIASIISDFLQDKGNTLRFNSQKYPDSEFKYIGMENIQKESGKLLALKNVFGVDIKSQTIKLPKGFFLYGKLRPYLNKYFYNDFNDKNIIVSSEFFVFSIKNINPIYFKLCLSSSFVQHQIINHMKGARMPRISENIFKNLKIPLPPPAIQNKIASHIQTLKNEIQKLKQQEENNKKLALSEFESEIFNAS